MLVSNENAPGTNKLEFSERIPRARATLQTQQGSRQGPIRALHGPLHRERSHVVGPDHNSCYLLNTRPAHFLRSAVDSSATESAVRFLESRLPRSPDITTIPDPSAISIRFLLRIW
ncbi:hypothetical protein Dimus_021777 [Dionaea muscipula]